MHQTWQSVALLVLLLGWSHPTWAQVVITQRQAQNGNVTPGDAPGFPVQISRPGSYRLASNLRVPDENTHAIDIVVNDVAQFIAVCRRSK